jgi:hypothetical protein
MLMDSTDAELQQKSPVYNLAEHSGFFTRSDADETVTRVPIFECENIMFCLIYIGGSWRQRGTLWGEPGIQTALLTI